MDASETIAVTRDIFIILYIALWLMGLIAVSIAGFRLYRTVKRITSRVRERYQTLVNGITGSLRSIQSRVSSLVRASSRAVHRAQRQAQASARGVKMTRGSAVSLILGGTVGLSAALLLAPRSGKETRQMLQDQANSIRHRARRSVTEIRNARRDHPKEAARPEVMVELQARSPGGNGVMPPIPESEVELQVRANPNSHQQSS